MWGGYPTSVRKLSQNPSTIIDRKDRLAVARSLTNRVSAHPDGRDPVFSFGLSTGYGKDSRQNGPFVAEYLSRWERSLIRQHFQSFGGQRWGSCSQRGDEMRPIEIRASFHLLESATKQRLLPWSLPNLMRKTVFFFVLFHR